MSAAPDFAVAGRLESLGPAEEGKLFDRGRSTDPAVMEAVAAIVADVRSRRDAALIDLARRFDGVEDLRIEVPRPECRAALDRLDPRVRDALVEAAGAIAVFHRAQMPAPLEVEVRPGVRLGRRAEPLGRVGVYAPGGRAAYPSSVLMGVVPARVAGVSEVLVCSPPGPDGRPPAAVLAACAIGGADRVFALGGAGAVAALAFGTGTVPRVDKVVGPGNAYVTEAKRQLTGQVAIDCPAGPSEILIVADDTADPELIAVELLAQAEHDPDAAAVLVTTDPTQPEAVLGALSRLLESHPRSDIVRSALRARGGLLVAASQAEALAFATRWAPEHLLLLVREPRVAWDRVRCAGTTFLGPASSVAFGDYVTGANHVLPTAGLARAYAGLSTLDFLRWATWQEVGAAAAAELAGPTAVLAEAEGLPGHAMAARKRKREGSGARERMRVRVREAYRDLSPYDPGRIPTAIDLSDNTNLFGVPPSAAAVLGDLQPDQVTRYPSVYATGLKEALAERFGVEPRNIATGAGSDDVIDSAFRAFCEPGDAIAFPWPTFGVIPSFARMNAAVPLAVPLGPDFALDADALLATGAGATYLCRPNNPTGNAFGREVVSRVIREARGIVVIDEAYADFAGDDVVAEALASERAIVVRTLSKAWGLAGLRLGAAIGPARLIAEVEKSRGPFKVGGAAEAAAVAALRNDAGWVEDCVARVCENRDRLATELRARGCRVWPSAANFLLTRPPPQLGARGLSLALRERGVQVRPFADLHGAGDAVRVGIGPWPMMERFLAALDEVTAATPADTRA